MTHFPPKSHTVLLNNQAPCSMAHGCSFDMFLAPFSRLQQQEANSSCRCIVLPSHPSLP